MKSIYEKALAILKNRISTLKLNHKIGNRDIANSEIKDIVKAIETHVTPIFEQVLTELEQAQKQEKLLELYKEYVNLREREIAEISEYEDTPKRKDIENRIKELEKWVN